MPIYKKEEEEKAKESEKKGTFKGFMSSKKTKQFIANWHEKGYTKAGVEELLYELYQRYGGDGDDDEEGDLDEKTDKHPVRKRAGEMLDIMKSVRGLFEPFKTD